MRGGADEEAASIVDSEALVFSAALNPFPLREGGLQLRVAGRSQIKQPRLSAPRALPVPIATASAVTQEWLG
jgi:hypothetical protein